MSALGLGQLGRTDAMFGMSAAMRVFIDREMLEAMVGRRGYRRSQEASSEPPVRPRLSRWQEPCDLRKFAPCAYRPHTAGGGTSFHLVAESIGREHVDGSGRSRLLAAEYERYLVVPGTAEKVSAERHEAYLVTEKMCQHGAGVGERADLVLSNISPDLRIREAFWNERTERTRKAGKPTLVLRPDLLSAEALAQLHRDQSVPASVRQLLITRPDQSGKTKPLFYEVTDDEELAWARRLGNRFGNVAKERAIHFRVPRPGRVELRVVAELPTELSRAERHEVAHRFAGMFRPEPTDGVRTVIPMTLVLHAPDHDNDLKNEHLHAPIAPARYRLLADGTLDHKTKRELRPGELAAILEPENADGRRDKGPFDLMQEDLRAARRTIARLCNEKLEASGHKRRLDPRTYEEMGIIQHPQKHLGPAQAARIKAGCSVLLDHANAIDSWIGEDRRRRAVLDAERALHAEVTSRCARLAEDTAISAIVIPSQFPDLIARQLAASARIYELADMISQAEMFESMAKSAPERLISATERALMSPRFSTANKPSSDHERRLIEKRNLLAVNHLEEIEQAAEPWRRDLTSARHDLAAERATLAALEIQLEEIERSVKTAVRRDAEKSWRDGSVLERYDGDRRPTGHKHLGMLIKHLQTQGADDARKDRFIYVEQDASTQRLNVMGLGPLDAELLKNFEREPRWLDQLERSAGIQAAEISRLHAAIATHGLTAIGSWGHGAGKASLRTAATHYIKYRGHPLYQRGEALALQQFENRQPYCSAAEISSVPRMPSGFLYTPPAGPLGDPTESSAPRTPTLSAIVKVDQVAPARMSDDPPNIAMDAVADASASSPLQEPHHDRRNTPLARLRRIQRGQVRIRESGSDRVSRLSNAGSFSGVSGLSPIDVDQHFSRTPLLLSGDPPHHLASNEGGHGPDLRRALPGDRGADGRGLRSEDVMPHAQAKQVHAPEVAAKKASAKTPYTGSVSVSGRSHPSKNHDSQLVSKQPSTVAVRGNRSAASCSENDAPTDAVHRTVVKLSTADTSFERKVSDVSYHETRDEKVNEDNNLKTLKSTVSAATPDSEALVAVGRDELIKTLKNKKHVSRKNSVLAAEMGSRSKGSKDQERVNDSKPDDLHENIGALAAWRRAGKTR